MEPFIALFKFLLDLLPKGARIARRGYRHLAFRWKDRRPPLAEETASNMAFSVLGGQIEQCIAFRSIDSNRTLIAVVRAGESVLKEIHLLEQFGPTFRPLWSRKDIIGLRTFAVDDVDGDGNKEIVFEEHSYGTGGGTKTLFVYSNSKRRLVSISEWLHWANAAGPVSPEVKIEPEPVNADDECFIAALEKYALNSGFLTHTTVDFNDPEFAVARWHVENKEPKHGTIKFHFYNGRPRYGASISQQLSGGGLEWIAFFKGPVFGYSEGRNEHFIAYSPAWTYNCAIAATYCCGAPWFVRHNESEARIYCFRLLDSLGYLDSYSIPGNPDFFQKLECRSDGILVNDGIFMPFSEMGSSADDLPVDLK